MRNWLIPLIALATLLAMTAGCIPSTASPSPQRDNVATVTPALTLIVRTSKPSTDAKADAAYDEAASLGVLTAGDVLLDNVDPVMKTVRMVSVVVGGVLKKLIQATGDAEFTTTTLSVPMADGVRPAKAELHKDGSATLTWDNDTAPAPDATPASLDQPVNIEALIGADK